MADTVNIAGIPKAYLLQALHANTRPLGMGHLHYRGPIDLDTAEQYVNGRSYFDYVEGCPIKTDIGGNTMKTYLYDRDAGEGRAEAVVAELRKRFPLE